MEFFVNLSMVDAHALLLPAVILLSYDFAAHSSLRTWLAVSQLGEAPAPETEQDAQLAKRRRVWKGIVAATVCILLITSESWIILSDNEKVINTFFGVLTGALLTVAHFGLWSRLFGLNWVVYRLQSGLVSYRLHLTSRSDKFRALSVFVWSILMAVFTLVVPSTTFKMLSTAALVVNMTSRGAVKTTSIRKLTIFFMVYEAIVIALSVGIIWLTQTNEAFGEIFKPSAGGADETFGDAMTVGMPSGLMTFFTLLVPAFYAAPVGHYLAACLRFDYHQSRTSMDEQSSPIVLETVAARSSRCRGTTSTGVVIPRDSIAAFFPTRSSKAYYLNTYLGTALLMFPISAVLNFTMKLMSDMSGSAPKDFEYFESQTFGMLSMFVIMPFLALIVGIQSSLRGERKALWTYTETWGKAPFKGLREEQVAQAAAADEERAEVILEKPLIVVEDVDAKEDTPLLTFEEAMKA